MKTTGFPGPYYGRFGGRGRDTPRGDLEHRLVVLAACVLAFVGPRCTGTARQHTVTMDPVRMTARPAPSGEVVVDAYDARDLLQRGNDALSAGRYEDALESFERLTREFADSQFIEAALYNSALCLEHLDRLEDAAARYLSLVERHTGSPDAPDSLFQATRCYERLERWADAIALLDRLLERSDLDADERLEAMSRRGSALVQLGDLDEGERQLRRAIAFYRREGGEPFHTDYFLAQAQHSLGEIPRMSMAAIELTNDEQQFRIALERRCELLLRAQTQYVQTIRIGNAHWAAASAYRIGDMYSSLYDEIMAIPVPEAEVPDDITAPEDVAVFREEYPVHYRRLLREYMEPLLHNAIRWWESNLMMVERTGVEGEWVSRTREQLERVRDLLDEIDREQAPGPETPAGTQAPEVPAAE
jgi:tetratricopeptide (TPR) repeat protein